MTSGKKPEKPEFALAPISPVLPELVKRTNPNHFCCHAIGCVERVMPLFAETFPGDPRPRNAPDTCGTWTTTGVFRIVVIRGAPQTSHAAACEAREDIPGRPPEQPARSLQPPTFPCIPPVL